MEDGLIFGSNVTLPSLPGLQSDCEEEIIMLMKEVDREFQRQNSTLLTELINARTLCKAQSSEIESLRRLLQSNNETFQKDNSRDRLKEYFTEIEKLKKENIELKNENSSLQRRLQLIPDDNKVQLESLKRSLCVQQDENKSLREKLSKIDQQYQSLQNAYQNVISRLTAFSHNSENQNTDKIDVSSSPSSTQDIVVQITEKFVSEETEYCNNFLSKINLEIDSLEKNLKKQLS